MTLREYLAETHQTATAFAAKVGTDKFQMSRLVNGRARPALDLAFRIEHATQGIIGAASWLKRSSKR